MSSLLRVAEDEDITTEASVGPATPGVTGVDSFDWLIVTQLEGKNWGLHFCEISGNSGIGCCVNRNPFNALNLYKLCSICSSSVVVSTSRFDMVGITLLARSVRQNWIPHFGKLGLAQRLKMLHPHIIIRVIWLLSSSSYPMPLWHSLPCYQELCEQEPFTIFAQCKQTAFS